LSKSKIKEIDKLTKKGDIAKAIECCQELLLNQPEDTNLHIRLGDLYLDRHLDIYQAKQYIDEAITEYQKAAEVLVDNGEVYYKIAIALYHKGDIDKAINYFNIAIELCRKLNVKLSDEEIKAEANKWEMRHGGLSGRTAQQFINHLLGMTYLD